MCSCRVCVSLCSAGLFISAAETAAARPATAVYFSWGAAPLRIKAAAGDQLEAIRCGRVAVEDGRSLDGDAAGRSGDGESSLCGEERHDKLGLEGENR